MQIICGNMENAVGERGKRVCPQNATPFFSLFLPYRMAPGEWEAPVPCFSDPPQLEFELTLHNCFWHNWGSLMQQGSDIAPK